MGTNPQDYDRWVPWIPQQNQPSETGLVTAQNNSRPQQLERPPHGAEQKIRAPQKMSRVRAQALAKKFKRWLAISSIMGFGAFGGLVAWHQTGSTNIQATSVSATSVPSQNSKSILKQQGGNNFGTNTTPTANSQASSATATSTSATSITPTATNQTSSAAPTPVSGTSVS